MPTDALHNRWCGRTAAQGDTPAVNRLTWRGRAARQRPGWRGRNGTRTSIWRGRSGAEWEAPKHPRPTPRHTPWSRRVPRLAYVARSLLAVLATTLASPATAQDAAAPPNGETPTGRLIGRVTSAETGQAVVGAQVTIAGTQRGTLTDAAGRYALVGIPAGERNLRVQSIGYAEKTVSAVEVAAGEMRTVDVALEPRAIALERIAVTAAVDRGATAALLGERRESSVVSDAIGSAQISRSPDGDAAAALRRVPGVSVVDGKYVYIRGLGERYGSTLLNGAPLPSPVPDKKAVPLDMIPSDLLESIVTAKSYSPDQPGDYAGGLVQIRTLDFPSFGTFSINTSLGYNTVGSLEEGLGYAGGGLDILGFDDGTRALPDAVPAGRRVAVSSEMSAGEIEQIGKAFDGAWGPTSERVPLDQSIGLSFGNRIELGDRPLGFVGSLTHSNSYSHAGDAVERVFSAAGAADPEVDYLGDVSTRSVATGALLNASFGLTPADQLSLAVVYNRLVDDEARVLEGYNIDANTDMRNTRIRYLAQSLASAQLGGTHELGNVFGSTLEWRAGYARAGRYEPNTREVLYRRASDGRFLWDNFVQSGSVFHQDLVEHGLSGGVNLEVPLAIRSQPASLEVGASADVRDRDVYTRRFRLVPAPGATIGDSIRALPPNELFAAANIGAEGFRIQEATFRPDNYDGDHRVYAGYALLDAELLPRLRVAVGARVEQARQTVTPRDLFETSLTALPPAELDATDVLPALNLTYSLAQEMNIRLGASRTLARPELRELAPFHFADYAGGYLVAGNPELSRSRIQNYDVRWEWFFRPDALIAVGGFYKDFDDPIEVLVYPSSELIKSWVNADQATLYGAELEVRTSLGIVTRALENVFFNANLTLVESEVATAGSAQIYIPGTGATTIAVVERDRPMQGQSPYVVNLGLAYDSPTWGTRATVLYNRFGRRIDSVGGQALPDVYEEARDQLDVVIEQDLPGGFNAKLSASRLLGNEVEFTQGGGTLRGYDTGHSFSLSIGWQPGGN